MNSIEVALATLTTPVYFIILALGIYSLTRLITTDSFPPIEKLRNWFFDRFPHDGYSTKVRPTRGQWVTVGTTYHVNIGVWQGELVSCPWCMGWWVSLLTCVGFVLSPTIALAVLTPFALRVIPGMLSRTFS